MKVSTTRAWAAWTIWASCFLMATIDGPVRSLWPTVVALSLVVLLRRVLVGLLAGGAAGAVILAGGNPVEAFVSLFSEHLFPAFESPWKVGAILFTLILGGFVALIERGGGLINLVSRYLERGGLPAKRLQWCALTLGIVCFFDGLANSMMVGRMLRKLADRVGVSRVKLAYIVDSTSASVACLAFVSTWIAYQLSMIEEGFSQAGVTGQAYVVFFHSIPYNFYCWFTLVLLVGTIRHGLNLGPMRAFEERAGRDLARHSTVGEATRLRAHWLRAVLPLGVLVLSILVGLYWDGAEEVWPVTLVKVADAFGRADAALVLVVSSAFAALIATSLYPKTGDEDWAPAGEVFQGGVQSLFLPVQILISAWILSSTLEELEAGRVISDLLVGNMPRVFWPASVFLVGTLISFSTGTSWGTMGILMPLAVPVVYNVFGVDPTGDTPELLAVTVAAVFSGAVFGDHCSPFSDTTIVSSISCEVEPADHVRTQFPYAFLAALATLIFGFILSGLSVAPWISLLLGGLVLWMFTIFYRRIRP